MEGTEKQVEGNNESILGGMVWVSAWVAFPSSNVFIDSSENRLLIRDLKEPKDSFLTICRQLSQAGASKQEETLKVFKNLRGDQWKLLHFQRCQPLTLNEK